MIGYAILKAPVFFCSEILMSVYSFIEIGIFLTYVRQVDLLGIYKFQEDTCVYVYVYYSKYRGRCVCIHCAPKR